ncbi:MAG TPA: DnaJ domain-containing protein [Kofleriaceae bacterium]|jgi:curved DNA-binding protein CbpA
MVELARGQVTDRPWGQTFGRLGARGLSGQLDVYVDGKVYSVAFARGAIVGASSPVATDAAVRIALTGHLVTSTQVADITRRLAASPHRDEIEVIAESAKLAPDQAQRLRRRVVAQRAARTFSLDRGQFVVSDRVTVPVVAGSELDVRAIIYLGARANLSETRLDDELALFGQWFQLKPEAVPELAQYGFTETEKRVLKRLIAGGTIADFAADDPQLELRAIRAIVYALAAYGACDTTPPPGTVIPPRTRTRPASVPPPPTQPPRNRMMTDQPTLRAASPAVDIDAPTVSRTKTAAGTAAPPSQPIEGFEGLRLRTPSTLAPSRTQTPRTIPPTTQPAPRPTTVPPRPKTATVEPAAPVVSRTTSANQPAVARTKSGSGPNVSRTKSPNEPAVARTKSGSGPKDVPQVARTKSSELSRATRPTSVNSETERLITTMVPLLERGANHFEILGVAFDAPAEQVRTAYFSLARKLHPDRLASLGIADQQRQAQRLFAHINTAFSTLTDQTKRDGYMSLLQRGGESAVRAEDAKAESIATAVMRAEEAFRQGEMALRREQYAQAVSSFTGAAELQPNEPEYQALLAWSKFAAADDKQAIAAATRTALLKAADASIKSVAARFYLGRVERMLGKEKEALAHFQEVLREKPHHAEAASEARILEQRLKGRR